MSLAVEVVDIWKRYVIQHVGQRARYSTVQETVLQGLRNIGRRLKGEASPRQEEFWALQGVGFELKKGERLGIIGRNGAGKSTLLKVLSRVTEPTRGRAVLKGRLASLLEVGTGFHPELTGRENIFLNGAILGMSKSEIKSQFDAIVAFAEVERFLDTPVKRYSSGMYMRLAFSVAAHLEPEILIIDEVLAVGDADFQRKCLGKVKEAGEGGRTVLFVSHNLGAVRQLCDRALVLDGGVSAGILPVEDAIRLYQSKRQVEGAKVLGRGPLWLEKFNLNGHPADSPVDIFSGDELNIGMAYRTETPGRDLCISVTVRSLASEANLFFTHNHLEAVKHAAGRQGRASVTLPSYPLAAGRYAVEVQAWMDGLVVVPEERALEFVVQPILAFGSKSLHSSFPSQLLSPSHWTLETDADRSQL